MKLNHLTIPVVNWTRSRDWYVRVLGLRVEFEIPDRNAVALRDDHGFTILLVQANSILHHTKFALTFQVEDVHRSFDHVIQNDGDFEHAPMKVFWGYGAQVIDPDGYAI